MQAIIVLLKTGELSHSFGHPPRWVVMEQDKVVAWLADQPEEWRRSGLTWQQLAGTTSFRGLYVIP